MPDTTPVVPEVAPVAAADVLAGLDGGWTSRKLLAAGGTAISVIAVAVIGGLVLGQYDAAGIWHGRLSVETMTELIEGAEYLVGGYLGINLIEKLGASKIISLLSAFFRPAKV